MMAIRHGITRSVLLVGGYAVKVPTVRNGWAMFLRGLLANLQERMWWTNTRDPRLCPVLLAVPGGWLSVMQRADCPEDPTRPVDFEGWSGLPATDLKPDNIGVLDGRDVLVDYGEFYVPERDEPREAVR